MTVPAGQSAVPPQGGRPRFLTGAEQSQLSWARVASSYDDVPGVYRPWLDPLLRTLETFPYILLTPTYEGYFRRENERLVTLADGVLHLVERGRDRLAHTAYRLDDISYIEVGSILLRGWLTVRGLAGEGFPFSSTLHYNTVTERLFAPILREFRNAGCPPSGASLDAERAKFDELVLSNYKFMNYSRSTILPGEEMIGYVLQPEIRETLLTMFGRALSRCLAPTHTAILTDRELILISEETGSLWQSFGTTRYGGIWHYVPLPRIVTAEVEARAGGLLALSIRLAHDDRLEALFTPSGRTDLESLVGELSGRESGWATRRVRTLPAPASDPMG